MIIRNAKIEDFEQILHLQLELENEECKYDSHLKKYCYITERGRKKLTDRINNESIIMYVAEVDDEIIGFIDGYIADEEWWYESPVAYLAHLIVTKKYRNKGVGSILIKKFEEEINAKGIEYIKLLVFNENDDAKKVYKDNGYTKYSEYLRKKI